MLVLKRRRGETIRIGSDMTCHVLRVEGEAVFIAVDAPVHLRIRRSRMDRAELLAARACIDALLVDQPETLTA